MKRQVEETPESENSKKSRNGINYVDWLPLEILCIILSLAWTRSKQPKLASVCKKWAQCCQNGLFFELIFPQIKLNDTVPKMYTRMYLKWGNDWCQLWYTLIHKVWTAGQVERLIHLDLDIGTLNGFLSELRTGVPSKYEQIWSILRKVIQEESFPDHYLLESSYPRNILTVVNFFQRLSELRTNHLELYSPIFIYWLYQTDVLGRHYKLVIFKNIFQKWNVNTLKRFSDFITCTFPDNKCKPELLALISSKPKRPGLPAYFQFIDCSSELVDNPDLLFLPIHKMYNFRSVLNSRKDLSPDHLVKMITDRPQGYWRYDDFLAIFKQYPSFDPSDIRYARAALSIVAPSDDPSTKLFTEQLLELYPREKTSDLLKLVSVTHKHVKDGRTILMRLDILLSAHDKGITSPEILPRTLAKLVKSSTQRKDYLSVLCKFLQKASIDISNMFHYARNYYCSKSKHHIINAIFHTYAKTFIRKQKFDCAECTRLKKLI